MLQGHTLQTTTHAEVERTLREHLAAFARGDFDAWGASLAPNVFFVAADPEEVFFTREAAVAEMHRDFNAAFEDGLQLEVRPQSSSVGYSSDGKVAWSAAPLHYAVRFERETGSFLLRHSNVLSYSDQRWSILATQYSLTLPPEKVLHALMAGHLPAPGAIAEAVGADAQGLAEAFKHQIANLTIAPISQNAFVFGPFPGDQAEGETAVRMLFADWASTLGVLRQRPDGLRAELISEEVGWVAANVEAGIPYVDQQVTLPLRALVVYRWQYGNWAIEHVHLSVGIPDELVE